jgi:hypothetical protein
MVLVMVLVAFAKGLGARAVSGADATRYLRTAHRINHVLYHVPYQVTVGL